MSKILVPLPHPYPGKTDFCIAGLITKIRNPVFAIEEQTIGIRFTFNEQCHLPE